jgi:metal-sulfur cluster biosynthetic enzyme
MLTEQSLREALTACFDPQLGLNIVALGLIHSIDLAKDPEAPGAGIPGVPPRQRLTLTLLPASDDEAYRAQLTAIVANRLAGLPEISRSTVQLADQPAWSPARISAEGRRRLNLDQPHFPILNNRLR